MDIYIVATQSYGYLYCFRQIMSIGVVLPSRISAGYGYLYCCHAILWIFILLAAKQSIYMDIYIACSQTEYLYCGKY